MNQYYIIEVQQNQAGEYSHLVHWAYDADATQARLKAESTYHTVLAAAAISSMLSHSATLIAADGRAIMQQCYKHEPAAAEPVEEEVVEGGQ